MLSSGAPCRVTAGVRSRGRNVTIDASHFSYLCDFILRRSAIVLTPEKEYLVESRLGPVARAKGFASIDALIAALRVSSPGPLQTSVVEAMTTHETTFFRDQHPFDALRTQILPALLKSRAASRKLVIFCAACSSGQEPYSIAMLIREHFPELSSWTVRIVGVDLSEAVLARAREGLYTQSEVNRGLPAPLLVKYFDRVGTNWQLRPVIRNMVELRQMNLIEPWPTLPRADLMFIRNVLIYFDIATKRSILGRAREVLARDGYLLLGGAETTLNVDDRYQRVGLGQTTVYRLAGAEAQAGDPALSLGRRVATS
jgi:chemotaxis protein methyltransferase CheR